MTIEAEHLESWIGADVLDSGGEKLGKVGDVYFRGSDPAVVGIKSGLGGRKHHLAALRGARVTRVSVRITVAGDAIVAGDGTAPNDAQLGELARHDSSLDGVRPTDLEGYKAREERLKAAAEARAKAEALEADAQQRKQEEENASAQASTAGEAAQEARRKREEAEAKAKAAREEAEAHPD